MNVKIVTKSGASFAGAAAYLLHDEGRNTAARVAWTDTQGLGTKNPDAAWRVMAATALDAERLKQEAGVGRQGRKKQGGPVMHLVLSWAEGEIEGLSAEEMRRAAREAVSKLGKDTTNSKKVKNGYRYYGDECQMLLVAHNDTPNPHVHVLLNRVHPQHGRMLPDGNDQLKLSRWAQKYQERHGNEHLTPQRTLNNAARDRGEYARGKRDLPRSQLEAMRGVADSHHARKAQLLAEQTRRAAALAKAQRELRAAQKKAMRDAEQAVRQRLAQLDATHRTHAKRIDQERRRLDGDRVHAVRTAYRERWEGLYHELNAQIGAFRENENKLIGRVQNALRVIDFAAVAGRTEGVGDGRVATFREAFGAFACQGAREAALKRQHEARERLLRDKQRAEEAAVRAEHRARAEAAEQARRTQEQTERSAARRRFLAERDRLAEQQAVQKAAARRRWHSHNRRCQAEWEALSLLRPAVQPPAAPENQPTRPQDLIGPKDGNAKWAAGVIDSERLRREKLRDEINAQIDRSDDTRDDRGGRGDRGGISR